MRCESSPLLGVKKCVTLLEGSEMSVGLHFMSLIIGFCSGGMATVAVAIS